MRNIVGMLAEASKTISESDIYLFAGISGDFNPIHINQVEAEKSVFGGRIAHGMLAAGLLSNVIGMKLPGPGTIYMEQELKFIKPVYIGDTLTAHVEVAEVLNQSKMILRLKTWISNQSEENMIEGFAVVKAPWQGESQK